MAKRALNGSWITTYYEQIDKISEAPTNYNMWAAISVVSSVLKNHVYYDRGTFSLQPNQYIVLVGKPGIGKGTAIRPAYEFPIKNNLINTIKDKYTAAKITEILSKGFNGGPVTPPVIKLTPTPPTPNGFHPTSDVSTTTIKAEELQTFLSGSDWMVTFLCEMWDRKDFDYNTKTSGTAVIKDMCVSLIGACVPAYLQSMYRETTAAINSGFTARCVFVYAQEKSKHLPDPLKFEELPNGKDIIKKLDDDLLAIASLKGAFSMAPDAKREFNTFYGSPAANALDVDNDVIQNFKARAATHVIKVAMALSAGGGDSLVISKQDIQVAINLIAKVQANLDLVFRGFGTSILAEPTSRVQEFIEKRKITTRREILTYNHRWVAPDMLDAVLNLLRQINFIREEAQGGEIKIILNKSLNGVVKSVRADLNP